MLLMRDRIVNEYANDFNRSPMFSHYPVVWLRANSAFFADRFYIGLFNFKWSFPQGMSIEDSYSHSFIGKTYLENLVPNRKKGQIRTWAEYDRDRKNSSEQSEPQQIIISLWYFNNCNFNNWRDKEMILHLPSPLIRSLIILIPLISRHREWLPWNGIRYPPSLFYRSLPSSHSTVSILRLIHHLLEWAKSLVEIE